MLSPAVSYINADWEAQDMWAGRRMGPNPTETALLKSKWLEKMAESQFINASDALQHDRFPKKSTNFTFWYIQRFLFPLKAEWKIHIGRMTEDQKK